MKLIHFLSAFSVLVFSPTYVQSQSDSYFGACGRGHPSKVREYIEQDATAVNMASEEGYTCLHLCNINMGFEVAELLIKNGANVNAMSKVNEGMGMTPLAFAVFYVDPRTVKLLLDNGADVNLVFEDFEGDKMTVTDMADVMLVREYGKTRSKNIEKIHQLLVEAGGRPHKYLIKNRQHEEL